MKLTNLTTGLLSILLLGFIGCDLGEDDPIETPPTEEGVLVINEFLASNDAGHSDEEGGFDDWVELYNGTSEAIDIGGMYFTDDPEDTEPNLIPMTNSDLTTIAAGGYLILWCDKEPEQGILHINTKLSSGGESVVLIDSDGLTVIDTYTFDAQEADVSIGRTPDGGETWTAFSTPTPGASNN
ncbi:MAG: lamin tail domain-containing protein [Candidatus Marinimicrobia bacterium]|jgi:hypothetical protein|nr:lamin tail domain-containing protein [Candidatus Neomarinimicrobiota bacterium]MBT3840308.1 lamin tail domain-containing protein [Candidatus Neomarinimicrobiota bacterium]MBT4000306.1 lamin tail domain-containing protein [Candidatus Neomarinimicrobiota bacterium]MBT4382604.1 lamin tail domain-containing protein [Candidatus Neomarinimicrobiota bacterium]MBT4578513.1 lamin tail domain-containing protein [Candidatus Neomarinimicrobiota bacterium]